MSTTRKTWISIIVASVIVLGILAVTAVAGTAYFFSRHISSQVAEPGDASQQFARARQRFSGQQPLIEVRKGDDAVVHREVIPAAMPATKLESLRVLAYDTHGEKLVQVSIPFWLLRIAPSRKFSFIGNGMDFDTDHVKLTLEDLEKRGPGLILDQTDRRGSQVLVWTE
jgi:hypothetical protein